MSYDDKAALRKVLERIASRSAEECQAALRELLECTVDLRLVNDPDAWQDFVLGLEPEVRALADTPEAGDILMQRLLGL